MIDVFVCLNDVNFTVTLGELRRRPRIAVVLYDPVRSDSQPRLGTIQRPLQTGIKLVRRLNRFHLLRTVYLPHHRINKLLIPELPGARSIGYLDDGLDTLRHHPRNFDLDAPPSALPASKGPSAYLTFFEYKRLPAWLERFKVRRVCHLSGLSSGRKPKIDLSGVEHLFVESPGLDVDNVIDSLHLDAARCMYVRHPVPAKRSARDAPCASVDGRSFDLEATLLAAKGLHMYFGLTMPLVFAILEGATKHNVVYAQLTKDQRDSLALPGRFEAIDDPGLNPPLIRAIDDGAP